MRAFLQSLDKKVWQAVEIGWTKPKEKPADWDEAKIKAANFNSRTLNTLFSAVTNEEFKKISFTKTAKEAWTILQTTYEGTKTVKDSKLQRLTTSFEEIKMEDDESFDEFYAKLKDIVNSAFNFGETIPKSKIVRKVLRSLPERFHAKIKATNFNSRALNALFNAVTNEEFKIYPQLKLPRRLGPFSKQPMRVQRLSRIQSCRDSLQALKK